MAHVGVLSCAGLNRWHWSIVLGLAPASFAACGPDHRPEEPCDGPSFNLVVRAESGPLPADTRINVRYGGNPDGEPYQLGKRRTPQAVACMEDTSQGGAPSVEAAAGAGGTSTESSEDEEVWSLKCGLYTQGPARLDVTATGFEPIDDKALSFEQKKHCEVGYTVRLAKLVPETDK